MALWSINGTEVDVFLKSSAVDGARQVLKDNNIPYTILVEDMQRQIEEENPPQSEIEQLQNRNGMQIVLIIGSQTGKNKINWKCY